MSEKISLDSSVFLCETSGCKYRVVKGKGRCIRSKTSVKSYKIRSFKLSKAFILLTEESKRTFGGAYCLIDRR